jgi:hypothetical protein
MLEAWVAVHDQVGVRMTNCRQHLQYQRRCARVNRFIRKRIDRLPSMCSSTRYG